MSWVGKIPWRRDRLPTPIFLGFPCGSAGKESACNSRDLGSIPGKIPWRKERLPTLAFWPGKYHRLYSLWGRKESDTTEWLLLFLSRWYKVGWDEGSRLHPGRGRDMFSSFWAPTLHWLVEAPTKLHTVGDACLGWCIVARCTCLTFVKWQVHLVA